MISLQQNFFEEETQMTNLSKLFQSMFYMSQKRQQNYQVYLKNLNPS